MNFERVYLMSRSGIAKRINRFVAVYSDFGIKGISSRLFRRASRLIGRDDPKHTAWLRRKSATDGEFDAANGTRTGGVEEIFNFKIAGENARYGLSHIASDPAAFIDSVGKLDIDFGSHTFIDLGSGKGRALMLAAKLPFRHIIGVEFAAELHEAAKANLAAFASNGGDVSRVSLLLEDAASYSFPNEPLVIYMFNPFGSKIVRQVAENALASWRAAPRSIQIFYVNPLHLSDVAAAGWRVAEVGQGRARLVPST
jgi:hypothetical protein